MGKLLFFMSYFLYVILRSKKSFHMLQQNFYNNSNRYIKWIFNNYKKSFLTVDWLFLIIVIIGLFGIDIGYLMAVFYFIMFIYYYDYLKFEQVKIGLKLTKRIGRMCITLLVLYVVLTILFKDSNYVYFLFGVLASLNSFIIYLVNVINKPVEKIVYLHYFNMAKGKLKNMNRMSVIGVTGSYGKTSSKNIVNDILSVKYNSFATPKNFNTPYGLIRSINNYLDKFNDVFIAEMGAFKVGEIKTTCKLMHPKHGILTTIGEAHLESFGSRENIQKGKFELIESLPSGGLAILNADDEWQVSYKLKNNKCKVLWIGIDNDADLKACNIKLSGSGTDFDVKFRNDDNLYHFHTRLLGKHNVYNLLAGILLGKELGMNISELQRGVNSVKTIEHRLELKKSGTINIIDDAYNSNPVGSKMALDVLKLMPGLKIVVTPGMIELGDKQYDLNKKFGEYISESADYVILVGKEQTKPIYDGLIEKGYNSDKIYVINNVVDAFSIMRRLDEGNTYVLLENDLPDLFNE